MKGAWSNLIRIDASGKIQIREYSAGFGSAFGNPCSQQAPVTQPSVNPHRPDANIHFTHGRKKIIIAGNSRQMI